MYLVNNAFVISLNLKMSELGFKELKVWRKAVHFADMCIELCDGLETDRKHFRLIEQLESASTSVSLNIAEGKGRQHKKEFIQYLYIARGSAYETLTLLNIFYKRNWIAAETLREMESHGEEVIKMLKGLINSIR